MYGLEHYEIMTNAPSQLELRNKHTNLDDADEDEGNTEENLVDRKNSEELPENVGEEESEQLSSNEDYEIEYNDETEEEEVEDEEEYTEETPNFQELPEYEPSIPVLNESFEAPLLPLKTTVLSSVELSTRTLTTTLLMTHVYAVTASAGDGEIITSTTEYEPQIQTSTVVDLVTSLTTLTLLDIDPTITDPSLDISSTSSLHEEEREEGRTLATRIMSNGVEVIVAGDKTTRPGDVNYRILTSSKPVTLKPSTLSDHMMMMLPQEATSADDRATPTLPPNQFVVKTCLTTFTYLTTYLDNGVTTVSSHEKVISNVATEDRLDSGKILPTPAVGVTLTQYPNLSVGVFHTTYTYLNTILDGEQPLVLSSKHVVTNTITAPDDYLSLLSPTEVEAPSKETNTYFSTIDLEKTLYEDGKESVISTREMVTQVVITESALPKTTSLSPDSDIKRPKLTTTDVVKTYFVTYTYYNTLLDNGTPLVFTNISTESDVVTEKMYIKPESPSKTLEFDILATNTYLTTFTYLTTLLQENNSTVMSSRTEVVENVATEKLDPQRFDTEYLSGLKEELDNTITKVATLTDGQVMQVTVIAKDNSRIVPTSVLPIQKTAEPSSATETFSLEETPSGSTPSVITGSTIVFVDDDPFANLAATPVLTTSIKATSVSTAEVKETKISVVTSKVKRPGTKSKTKTPAEAIGMQPPNDLLGLGSINIDDTLQVLTPVLSAMAGYINKNLKSNRRSDNVTTEKIAVQVKKEQQADSQNRSPVYIPVGGVSGDDFEIAESQNVATFDWVDSVLPGKPNKVAQESPLLSNGIPISPGDVITTNSDVIVGKIKGRVGPRLPSIPFNPYRDPRPPPHPKFWLTENTHEYAENELSLENQVHNIVHVPNKDDYVGPPPPVPKENKRHHSHVPKSSYREHSLNQPVISAVPVVLPEVIERSTGQPLLVQLQPSQVALVKIPFNRTTALVYGGATEPHVSGQYFDDPSPYPEPEYNREPPRFTSNSNQKRVTGVMKVESHQIHPMGWNKFSPELLSQEVTNVKEYYPVDSAKRRPSGTQNYHISQFMEPPPFVEKPAPVPFVNVNKYHLHKEMPASDAEFGSFGGDLESEDGEVIQESNARPLRPGEVPIEILNEVSTQRTTHYVRFPTVTERKPQTRITIPISYDKYYTTPVPKTTRYTRPAASSANKPLLIFIDENGSTSNYFDTKKIKNSRPKVTSLPIDHQTLKPRPSGANPEQTEVPFAIPTEKVSTAVLNIGEVTRQPGNSSKINDLVVMKPPPLLENVPHVEMFAPATRHSLTRYTRPAASSTNKPVLIFIDENGHSTNYFDTKKVKNGRPKVTSLPIDHQTLKTPPSVANPEQTEVPFVISTEKAAVLNTGEVSYRPSNSSNDLEVMKPPPLLKEVPADIGKSPIIKSHHSDDAAPPTTTEIVLGMSPPPLAATRKPTLGKDPIYPIEMGVAQKSTTTKPLKRPGYRRSTTRIPARRKTSATKRPASPTFDSSTGKPSQSNNQKRIIQPEKVISPSPTAKTTPSLSIIVSYPSVSITEKRVDEFPTSIRTPSLSVRSSEKVITTAVHHAGNQMKVVDEKVSRSSVPTKYVTYTKTLTVTITKTTVVTTSGGPPSTMTILVTKTEKSYIIDTVTEYHTLVKPTSIVETITTTVQPSLHITPSVEVASNGPDEDSSLKDFIVKDTVIAKDVTYNDADTIFVVMTDKNNGGVVKMPAISSEEVVQRDEITENEVSNVLLGGVLTANRPTVDSPEPVDSTKCLPDCKPTRNEVCQKIEGAMRCMCRPGFARMFPDRPCNPTYTYSINVTLDHIRNKEVRYTSALSLENSTEFVRLARKTHEGVDRMVMQSDLRDVYHGIQLRSFEPGASSGVVSRFYLQLSDNTDERRLEDILRKYLRNSNYSLGGTDVFTSSRSSDSLKAEDFNECYDPSFQDCSKNAHCFNLRGTYTCSCKEGYSDLSENMLYPGRICSAERTGCEKCNYHGMCSARKYDQIECDCFHWYAGENCHINLKALLIALVTLGTILFALLLVCVIMTWVKKKPQKSSPGMTFLPQKMGNTRGGAALDRRAMIEDTSSEDSRSETNALPPYVQQKPAKPIKGALKKVSRVSMTSIEQGEPGVIFPDQKDRSLTVMIPRAKYHPAPPTSPILNYTSFDARKPSVPSVNNEAKLLSYLDAGPSPKKSEAKRKFSNSISESYVVDEQTSSRKTSGALVSAGFQVSATVSNLTNTMCTLGTACSTEADRSENATLKISADLLSSTDSQFHGLLRKDSLIDDGTDSNSNWLDVPRITTASEAQSYDETIPPPMKSFRGDYDSKSSQQHNDEANTMAERDLGSTFLLPHTHLYKPDRGSDISGFESL
ncbi:uncharacterized protein LOC132698998 [Cylas formicarius]|uniref:uncharacterized protein LOC132698998 n=1 Tax=Cylas formicarius TaxID=197179 RepID=UPI002958C55D|nr:uncharacterized protein LOC132698998 [Cylas formicarius]